MSWKVTAFAPRDVVQAALVAHEDAWDWDHDIVIAGSEIAEDKPDDWRLEAWLPRKPSRADKAALARDTIYATVMIISSGVIGICLSLPLRRFSVAASSRRVGMLVVRACAP